MIRKLIQQILCGEWRNKRIPNLVRWKSNEKHLKGTKLSPLIWFYVLRPRHTGASRPASERIYSPTRLVAASKSPNLADSHSLSMHS
mgnify:FL=1